MDLFLQQTSDGLAFGGIYACVALAVVMIYQATDHLNFAQGEMAMFSTYIAYSLLHHGVPYWWTFLLTMAISFIGGVLVERVIVRPVEGTTVLNEVIVFIGLLAIFNSLAGWIWDYTIKPFPSPFPDKAPFGITFIGPHDFGEISVTLVVLAAVFLFFRFTPVGLAMRAAAQNPDSARLVGIRVGWMLALGWGLAALVGAVAGMLIAPVIFLEPNMMSGVLLYAFAAALLGGISSPVGAVVGGLIVGVLENLVGTYLIAT
ncbi:MAG TPA: branched-chain amino acid ABC transporter permease, partial [Burkholderiales bacterium]|nr:branched-chain amino acid ABC transporter permease [Burkholderiales bacterium]